MLAAVAAVTICIVLLMFLLKAPFFAPWLSAACLAMAALTLLMIGDKERLLRGNVAWVGVHGVVVSALFLVVGYVIEWATAPRVARTFYWTGTALFAVSTWVVAAFGTKEWLRGSISYDDDTLNLWLLTYSVPFFLCGLCAERFGTEGQRNLAWVYYYLVPVFLLVPLNLLVSSGWEIWDIGEEPFTIYEIIYLLASVGLLVVGRCLHIRAFIFAGLWGLAIFVMRMTYRHLLDYLAWPVVVGIAGGAALSLGILLPLWLQRRREPHRARPKALQAPASTMPARPEPETLPLPGN
jgi:hypothetical protein